MAIHKRGGKDKTGWHISEILNVTRYYAHCYNLEIGHPWDDAPHDIQNLTEDDVYNYFQELPLYCDNYEKLIKVMANEIFNILFTNRLLMGKFNSLISHTISSSTIDDIPEEYVYLFKKDGVLKRTRIPEWAKRAIKFRDHGYCVRCHKDISEIRRNISESHIDHIIPLADGGLNDISNLQLLCEHCNTQKGDRDYFTSNSSIDWYK